MDSTQMLYTIKYRIAYILEMIEFSIVFIKILLFSIIYTIYDEC